jgi:hypothetical protein
MLLRALDLAFCIQGTRAADRWLMSRLSEECHELAYRLRRKLTEQIRNESPLVLAVAYVLSSGAGEYGALISTVRRMNR